MVFAAATTAQEVIRVVNYTDTGLLRHLYLQASDGKKQPVLKNDNGLNILVFLSPECPISKNSTKTLNELSASYKGKANFIGIVPGRTYSLAEVDSFVHMYKPGFKLYIDQLLKLTQSVGATVTPEVILFRNDGRIIYRGAIDDWAVSPGKNRLKATRHYLRDALDTSLKNKNAILSNTRPVGCLINNY